MIEEKNKEQSPKQNHQLKTYPQNQEKNITSRYLFQGSAEADLSFPDSGTFGADPGRLFSRFGSDGVGLSVELFQTVSKSRNASFPVRWMLLFSFRLLRATSHGQCCHLKVG